MWPSRLLGDLARATNKLKQLTLTARVSGAPTVTAGTRGSEPLGMSIGFPAQLLAYMAANTRLQRDLS